MFQDFKPEIKLFLIVAAISAVLAAAGILLLQAGLGPSSPTPPSQPAPQPQEQSATNNQQSEVDTSTWQTYRSDEFGFEVKYPKDWALDASEQFQQELIGDSARVTIDILENENPGNVSFEEWVRVLVLLSDPLPRPLEEYASDVNGAKAYRFDPFDENDRISEIVIEGPTRRNVFVLYITSKSGEDSKITDQILATFRFVEMGKMGSSESDDITATTDKKEYVQGEVVNISIRNNTGTETAERVDPFYRVERFQDGARSEISQKIPCNCGGPCATPVPSRHFQPYEVLHYRWSQQETFCDPQVELIARQAPVGTYRIKFHLSWSTSDGTYLQRPVYSESFVIR